jgi:hypothetical protein
MNTFHKLPLVSGAFFAKHVFDPPFLFGYELLLSVHHSHEGSENPTGMAL